MRFFLGLFVLMMATNLYALDPKKCFKVTHGAGLVTYDFPGYSSAEYITKKHGTTMGTLVYTQQSATASVDPSVTTGHFTSTSQFSSSEGGCSYYSYHREVRKQYVADNLRPILESVAVGRGEHMKSLYRFSLCANGGYDQFRSQLQARYSSMAHAESEAEALRTVDRLIGEDDILKSRCPYLG